MKNSTYDIKNQYTVKRNDDDEEDDVPQDKFLGYNVKNKIQTCISVPIDEGVQKAVYYRHVCKAISELGSEDQVEFEISSPGGYVNGLIALLTAMAKTDATTVAHINGECHSAASMLALACDSVYVSPFATMLVHFIRFGASGKGTDVKSQVEHTYDTAENLFREIYQHFLTEDEMQRCIDGKELWLNYDQINERLKRKFDILNGNVEKEKKVRKSRTKSKEVNIELNSI